MHRCRTDGDQSSWRRIGLEAESQSYFMPRKHLDRDTTPDQVWTPCHCGQDGILGNLLSMQIPTACKKGRKVPVVQEPDAQDCVEQRISLVVDVARGDRFSDGAGVRNQAAVELEA